MSGMRSPWFRPRWFGSLLAAGFSLLLTAASPVAAQESALPAPSGVAAVVRQLSGQRPTPAKTTAAPSATRFKPSGSRIFVPKLVAALSEDADERKTFAELFETALSNLDDELKKKGMPNDIAPALALYTQTLATIHGGKEAPEAGADKMVGQIRAALNGPEVAGLSDAEKQSLYEYWTSMSVLNLALYQAASSKGKETLDTLRAAAGEGLTQLFGAKPENVAITAKGLEITGPVAAAPAAPGPKATYAMPPDTRVENLNGTTILWRPKYDGYTKNEVEQYYYAFLPTIPAAGKPDREAVFEEQWNKLTESLKVTWKNRTLVHRFYLPSGAVCYVATGGERHNETFGGYGSCDGTRMTLCLLDFGSHYVPVAQVYSWTNGTDNLGYLQGAFDALVATVRLPGAPKPQPYATRDQVVGAWTHTDGFYNSTDYVFSSNGAYAGNVTNVSSSRLTLSLNPDGTAKYEFFWYYNGRIQTEVWAGKWTFSKGVITLLNPKTGKSKEWTVMYRGKHPKTNERFLSLHHQYRRDAPVSPLNSHSSDTELFTPLKK